MEKMEHHHHHHGLTRPLLHQSTPPIDIDLISSNHPSIIIRLSLVAFIGIVSILANHEASKGFAITTLNEPGRNTLPGKRFQLFYVSNDEATRVVIKASKTVESFLYSGSDSATKKSVRHVILKLAARNLTDDVIVESGTYHDEFVLNISPSIMEGTNFGDAMALAMQRGVARIWLWDGQGNAPINLINGIVEYLMMMILNNLGGRNWALPSGRAEPSESRGTCWNHEDSRVVAGFLSYFERRRPGFIRRLNQFMKDGWDIDSISDVMLGLPLENLCATYDQS